MSDSANETAPDTAAHGVEYDEFGLFHENAEEFDLPYDGPPVVRRDHVVVAADGRALSALIWGEAPAELVLLHGGAQNAHTWDTVAMALGMESFRMSPMSGRDSQRVASGLLTTSGNATALGTSVWATERAVRALAGVPAMYGLSPPLPAAATVSMPSPEALSTASDRSSSKDSP